MEDILSSIKKIIAEEQPARPRRVVSGMVETPAPTAPVAPADVLELTEVAAQPPSPPPPPAAAPSPALLSQEAMSASRSRLAQLSALKVVPAVAGSDTLEGLVRELLKPLLAEWLDANLPAIVERIVQQEVQRLTPRG